MATTIDRDSTEFIYIGVTLDIPTLAEIAFMAANTRPVLADWKSAQIVNDNTHALWGDAQASGVTGDYYIARLVGPYNANDLTLVPDMYQIWLRLTFATERPVRIVPEALEVL